MGRMMTRKGRGKRPSPEQRQALARKLNELLSPETHVDVQAGRLLLPGRLRF
ncbi:MAG: hypothetical protein ACYCW6_31875 [Candidatus Xenobia bacterium]